MHWTLQALLVLVGAAGIVALTTPVVRSIALQHGFVDRPGARKLHRRPIPLLGGIALFLGFLTVSPVLYVEQESLPLAGILCGAALLTASGVWDDRKGMSVSGKLLVQLIAAVLLILTGTRVDLPLPPGANIALTLFWVLGITNAFNLLDNMDGLTAGIAAVAAGFFLFLAAINGQPSEGLLAAAVLGGCLGFLIYNFNPARIFLGDAGSLLLGFLMAALGLRLRFPDNTHLVTWMVPILVLAVPIFDTTLVFFSRLQRKKNPLTTPGRDHVSHRLVQAGLSQRQAVSLLYLAAAMAGGSGVLASFLPPEAAYPLLGAVLLIGAVLSGRVERWHRG